MDYFELMRFSKVIAVNIPSDHTIQPFLLKVVSCVKNQHLSNLKRMKDLEQLSYFLFHCNYKEKDIFQQILLQVKKCPTNHPDSGRCLVFLLNFVVKSGVIDQELISDLMRKANDFGPFRNQIITVDYCFEFLCSIYGHNWKWKLLVSFFLFLLKMRCLKANLS